MKKIRLDLDVLVVETFEPTTFAAGASGTVEGHAERNTAERHCSADGHWTCDFSCKC